MVGGAARPELEACDVPLPALRLSPARDEPARADLAGGRHVEAASRTRRVRRRREADDLRRVAQDATAATRAALTRGYTVASQAPVAQGIERCPAEAEVACSNHAGRTFGCRWAGLFSARTSEYSRIFRGRRRAALACPRSTSAGTSRCREEPWGSACWPRLRWLSRSSSTSAAVRRALRCRRSPGRRIWARRSYTRRA